MTFKQGIALVMSSPHLASSASAVRGASGVNFLALALTHAHCGAMRKPTTVPDSSPEKNQAAAELGRRGGLKGGAARAANMTPEQRAEASRLAARARWAQAKPEQRTAKRTRDGEPFTFVLNPAEIAQITDTPVTGSGGLQDLQRMLQDQLAHGAVVKLDNAELGRLIRYMTKYERGGGFEDRLRRAFADSFLHLFTPIFQAERR